MAYDSGTRTRLTGAMDALDHERFAAVGHDRIHHQLRVGAVDRDRVDRLVFAEIPGPPGVGCQGMVASRC
jgi:hypothetical protein